MKKPASEWHLTFALAGSRAWNLSQLSIAANPPAEQPERIAYNQFKYLSRGSSKDKIVQYFSNRDIHFVHFSSLFPGAHP